MWLREYIGQKNIIKIISSRIKISDKLENKIIF